MCRTAEGFHTVARLKGCGFTETFDNLDHAIAVENASNMVSNRGHDLPAAGSRELREHKIDQCAPDIGERISVEE